MVVVLVTGGAGFIASHVVDLLVMDGHSVVVLDCLTYAASVKNINPQAVFVKGDIRDSTTVSRVLRDYSISVVMHFAAHTHVDASFGNSLDFTHTNALGTHVMLEAVREYGKVVRFVHVSTDEVYGSPATAAEDDIKFTPLTSVLMPTNPYAASKAAAEMIVSGYRISYGLPIIITRCNNVYGPRQYPEKIVPVFSRQALANQKVTIHGSGLNKRAYLHVTDAARAFLIILEKGVTGHVYNIGVEDELTNLQVAADIIQHTGSSSKVVHVDDRLFNDTRYPLDITPLHALGWVPWVSWKEGLADTIQWYKVNPNYWQEEAADFNAEKKALTTTTVKEGERWLVWGGKTGWIGQKVMGLLQHAAGGVSSCVHATQVRLQNAADVASELDRFNPTRVVNCAGVTGRPNVDWCETHQAETTATNVIGACILAKECAARGIHLTNFSTGCIYEYDAEHPVGGPGFTETDEPNFTASFYSRTKVHAEKLIHGAWDGHVLTLRVRMPIDSQAGPRDFVTKIASYAKVVNVPNSMTVLDDMLPHAITLATRRVTGVLNFVNPGVLSHNEVLELYKEHVNPEFTWTNFSLQEQARIIAAPRSNNALDTARLQSALGVHTRLTPLRDALVSALRARAL